MMILLGTHEYTRREKMNKCMNGTHITEKIRKNVKLQEENPWKNVENMFFFIGKMWENTYFCSHN